MELEKLQELMPGQWESRNLFDGCSVWQWYYILADFNREHAIYIPHKEGSDCITVTVGNIRDMKVSLENAQKFYKKHFKFVNFK